MQQEANFEKDGHPGLFPSCPKVSCKEWDIIQGMHVRTLLCTHVVSGKDHEWDIAVGDICSSEVCRTVTDLFENLMQARRTKGRPGAKKGDRSDCEAEGDCRDRVQGPSTAMEEVSISFLPS